MILSVLAVVFFAAAAGFGIWYGIIMKPNPPLATAVIHVMTSGSSTSITSTVPVDSPEYGENPPLPNETIEIKKTTFVVELATTAIEQTRGLSFRQNLEPNHGMLFLFGSGSVQNFWMKDMNFPIDMIWISGSRVVGFAENAAPQPGDPLWKLKIYSSPDRTDKVLEVPAGTVAKDAIAVGDVIQGL